MDVRRFGFQSWDDGTRLYRASRGPAILPHPLLRLEPCRCWCGAGANQPNPTHRTHSPSPAPPRLNRPPSFSTSCSFALHFLLFLHRLLLVLVLILFLLHLLLLLLLLLLPLLLLLLLLLLLPLLLCHPRPATHCYLPLSFTSTYCFSFSCLRSSVSQTTPPSPHLRTLSLLSSNAYKRVHLAFSSSSSMSSALSAAIPNSSQSREILMLSLVVRM